MALSATRDQGKTSFVKEILNDNPQANAAAVNEAWTEAGMGGSISTSLVNRMRSEMGLTGNLRSRPGKKARGKSAASGVAQTIKRGRKPGRSVSEIGAPSAKVETRGRKSARSQSIMDLEAEVDRLLFRVMQIGDLPEIEDSLRKVRRQLYSSLTSGR